MPFNPGGVFSLVSSYFATAGATIKTEQHNPPLEDIAAGMSQVLVRDGRAPMTGPLNMNNFPINNVAAGASPGSVATLAQAMPIGAVIDFAGAAAPAGWALCYGQALSRTTYADLFALIGTTYGSNDGSSFNLPDLRGLTTAAPDNMGGSAAGRLNSTYFGADPTVLGNAGGGQSHTLTTNEIPAHTHANTLSDPGHSHSVSGAENVTSPNGTGTFRGLATSEATTTNTTGITISNASQGGGAAHSIVQPTRLLNKIIRVSYDG